nr:venom protein [Lampona murina]
MKTFLLSTLLVAVVYCATTVQAEEIDVAVVDSNDEEDRQRFSTPCIEVDNFCTQDCNCCGKDGYCNWNSYCTLGGGAEVCESKSRLCKNHRSTYGPC